MQVQSASSHPTSLGHVSRTSRTNTTSSSSTTAHIPVQQQQQQHRQPATYTINAHSINGPTWHEEEEADDQISDLTHQLSKATINSTTTTVRHTTRASSSTTQRCNNNNPGSNSLLPTINPQHPSLSTHTNSSPRPTSSTHASRPHQSSSTRVVKPSLTPGETLKNPSLYSLLTAFEQSEILEFSSIYFVGSIPSTSKIAGLPHTSHNNGYDDERGDYKVVMGDHLEYRYEVLSLLGKGSFGAVLKCFDHKKDMIVALKIIRNKKRFHHQALIEVKILEHLMAVDREHKSQIVRVHGYFYFRNHLCITFEPLSINLYEFIKNNHFQGLSLGLIRRFAIQLLTSLSFLSQQKIIHCDLKPENILLKSLNKSSIRLIDFGSSCFEDERIYTYIQSRFYRSPEVLLGLPYSCAIDMWSLGCILCELYTGYPLFPGENEHEQLLCQMEVLGLPPKRMVTDASRRKQFFDSHGSPIVVANSRGKIRIPGSKSMESAVKSKDAVFLSFIRKCLRWEPKMRLTPELALQHEWIRGDEHIRQSNPSQPSSHSTQTYPSAQPILQTNASHQQQHMQHGASNTFSSPRSMFPPISSTKVG